MIQKAILKTSIIFLVIALALGVQILIEFSQDKWWTPMNLASTAEEARDRVAIYVQGQRIEEQTELGEVRVRFNNRSTIARERLIPVAFALGVGLALLGVAMLGARGARRPS